MPIYEYTCPMCGRIDEAIQGMNDQHVLVCECGMDMDRIWSCPTISGDLPTKGISYAHYDDVSGKYIENKTQWEEAKKSTGRVDYVADSEITAAAKEAKYIADHAKPGDKEASVASCSVVKKVFDKKRDERVFKEDTSVKKAVLKELQSIDI